MGSSSMYMSAPCATVLAIKTIFHNDLQNDFLGNFDRLDRRFIKILMVITGFVKSNGSFFEKYVKKIVIFLINMKNKFVIIEKV